MELQDSLGIPLQSFRRGNVVDHRSCTCQHFIYHDISCLMSQSMVSVISVCRTSQTSQALAIDRAVHCNKIRKDRWPRDQVPHCLPDLELSQSLLCLPWLSFILYTLNFEILLNWKESFQPAIWRLVYKNSTCYKTTQYYWIFPVQQTTGYVLKGNTWVKIYYKLPNGVEFPFQPNKEVSMTLTL